MTPIPIAASYDDLNAMLPNAAASVSPNGLAVTPRPSASGSSLTSRRYAIFPSCRWSRL
jgi:hypothetical protein